MEQTYSNLEILLVDDGSLDVDPIEAIAVMHFNYVLLTSLERPLAADATSRMLALGVPSPVRKYPGDRGRLSPFCALCRRWSPTKMQTGDTILLDRGRTSPC